MVNPVYITEPILGKDIKLSISGSKGEEIQKALEARSRMLGRVRGYEFKGAVDLRQNNRSKFTPPIYDLSEIGRAADVEPYIVQSIRKHREQILKEGFHIHGIEDDMVSYVKQRLFEISLATGITTEQWLREIVTNLVTYHNAFLIFRRDAGRSSGMPIKMYGKTLAPIAGIFVGDPVSMEVAVDKYGTPKKWRQKIEGVSDTDVTADKTYNIEDVVHITVDKKTGFTFGTPYLLPVLDDIRALRKLEEVAIIMASKEAFPLYHYKVGTNERPAIYYEGGKNEIDEVNAQVATLPAQGYIVTSERHEVKLISREGAALDLSPYLGYFETRVIAGLRLSPLDLGRGGGLSRGTATNINKGLEDSAKDYQQVISDHITYFVILPLLLEGGFDVLEENLVQFSFPKINKDEERAYQNHGMQMYLGNVITASEFRKKYLNLQPLTEQQRQDISLRYQTDAQKELALAQAAARTPVAGPDLGVTAVRNQVTNRGQPANQSGVKPAASRFKANDYLEKILDKFKSTKNLILQAIQDPNTSSDNVEEYFRDFVKGSVELSKEFISSSVDEGYIKAKKQFDSLYPDKDVDLDEIGSRALDRFFNNFVTKSFWKVINPYKDQINQALVKDLDNNIDSARIISCLSLLENSIKILTRDQIITSERFGFIKFAKKVGSKTIDLVNPDTEVRTQLDISELVYKNFIPTSDDIDHFLSFTKVREENCE